MFSSRWQILARMMERCAYSSFDRLLLEEQALHLFHAFLLQTKENEGTVYIIESNKSGLIAPYFVFELIHRLKIRSRGLIPNHQHFNLPLAILLKKIDLLIALCKKGDSPAILGAVTMAKSNDIPLITLSGGSPHNSLKREGDLNVYFTSNENSLILTGHFLFLEKVIESWDFGTTDLSPKSLSYPQNPYQRSLRMRSLS